MERPFSERKTAFFDCTLSPKCLSHCSGPHERAEESSALSFSAGWRESHFPRFCPLLKVRGLLEIRAEQVRITRDVLLGDSVNSEFYHSAIVGFLLIVNRFRSIAALRGCERENDVHPV